MDADVVRVDDGHLPVAYKPTTALAYYLSESTAWHRELWGFVLGDLLQIGKATNLGAMVPHRPAHISVVFVHGTASSVARWADLANDLVSNPRIR
jgi:hypothetical protein